MYHDFDELGADLARVAHAGPPWLVDDVDRLARMAAAEQFGPGGVDEHLQCCAEQVLAVLDTTHRTVEP